MLGKLGTPELLVILGIVLLIFGPQQLPKLGKTFGKTIRSFKNSVEVDEDENNSEEK
ncbi:twin-arginine translocase TatA/TatE family subunit [Alkalibaculum sp. M08DMB]|uniref:Sec-independent protein translocase protein TatA n=1 Tax=Alkalibaculum sporogenes TaxID=2655001 RepID=A0A6A7KCF0_9FIRM|nr:twin-arginine translocase TatA/TatE family subunit [Alkalibaculum sporogenes]MPW27025.1 twin-arginine translocase TatA/TatE family subunit [Alkalibaculum sporogenes]